VIRQFYLLRHAGTKLANLTPVHDLGFVRMFQVPWYSSGWNPPDQIDHM
jgi:hypothetical protein